MEVLSSAMGPERVLPNSEDELGGSERPADGAMLPAWSGGEEGEVGSEMELDGEEEENDGGYYYQPLNQEPEGEERAVGQEDTPPSTEQLQQRIQGSQTPVWQTAAGGGVPTLAYPTPRRPCRSDASLARVRLKWAASGPQLI
ncbi:uncharacterized protein LOC144383365 [Gasterosteus aculeatus]